MTNSKHVPKRRFKEFELDGEWVQTTLKEVAENFEYGLNAAAKEFDGINKYIRITDIDDMSREFLQLNLCSPDVNLEKLDKYILSEGDVLFARTGASTGKTYYYKRTDGKVYFAGFLIKAKIKQDFDFRFIFQNTLCNMYQKYIEITSQRSGQPGVNAAEYGRYSLRTPSLSEQKKIGDFFQTIDSLITLHQHKLDKLKNLKKSYLAELFPAEGERVPKRRFPGFEGDWEEKDLGSLCEVFTDGDWIETKDQSDSGVRLLQTGNVGITEYLDKSSNTKWISEKTFEKLHCKEVLPGDILISRLPEPAGRACIIPNVGQKMITSVDCTIVRTKSEVSSGFLVQYLASALYFNAVATCLAGGTRQRISRSNLANISIVLPTTKTEQKKIGDFFNNVDKSISLQQEKLDKLKDLKKAYLNELFV